VRKIVLNFNAINDRLTTGAWSGVERVLQELQLAECQIQTLPVGFLNDMFELRSLHLWNNKISTIAPNFFKVRNVLYSSLRAAFNTVDNIIAIQFRTNPARRSRVGKFETGISRRLFRYN